MPEKKQAIHDFRRGLFVPIEVANAKFYIDREKNTCILVGLSGGVLDPREVFITNPCPLVDGSPVHPDGVRRRVAPSKVTLFKCGQCPYHRLGRDNTGTLRVVCTFTNFMRDELSHNQDNFMEMASAFEAHRDGQ